MLAQDHWFQARDQALWTRVLSVLPHPPRPQCSAWPLACTFDQGLTDGWFDLSTHALQPLLQVADATFEIGDHAGWPPTLAALVSHVPCNLTSPPTCLRAHVHIDPPRLHVDGHVPLGRRAVVPLLAVDLQSGSGRVRMQASTHAAKGALSVRWVYGDGQVDDVCIVGEGQVYHIDKVVSVRDAPLVGVALVASGGDVDVTVFDIFANSV